MADRQRVAMNGGAVGIGLLGHGAIGAAVARALTGKAALIAAQAGAPAALRRVLVRDASRPRELPPDVELTDDPSALLDDPRIGVVVEAMGGERPAFDYIQRALHAGKHVVTANKEVMAKHGPEALAHAAEHGVALRFEASVGGGIPIIGPLLRDLAANDVTAVNAIINGTTNYMLTRMAQEGAGYAESLRHAQELGYAEPEPSSDVQGHDAAYKLAILASLAFRTRVRADDVYREGIERLTAADFRYAAELGYVIKLLAVGRRTEDGVQARVHPAFLPAAHPLASVSGVLNAVELEGDLVGWAMFQGPGAGPGPTASAIVSDVVEVVRGVASGMAPPPPPALDRELRVESMDDLETQYYLRLRAADRPGVMAAIAHVLGARAVSLASVIQKEPARDDGTAEIVITTHKAREAAVRLAVEEIEALDAVLEVSNLVRVAGEAA